MKQIYVSCLQFNLGIDEGKLNGYRLGQVLNELNSVKCKSYLAKAGLETGFAGQAWFSKDRRNAHDPILKT